MSPTRERSLQSRILRAKAVPKSAVQVMDQRYYEKKLTKDQRAFGTKSHQHLAAAAVTHYNNTTNSETTRFPSFLNVETGHEYNQFVDAILATGLAFTAMYGGTPVRVNLNDAIERPRYSKNASGIIWKTNPGNPGVILPKPDETKDILDLTYSELSHLKKIGQIGLLIVAADYEVGFTKTDHEKRKVEFLGKMPDLDVPLLKITRSVQQQIPDDQI